MDCREAAKKYINRGWSVIPTQGKIPLIPWLEFQTRITNKDTVDLWWDKWPNANVGIITGKISGITVIDIDGEKGKESLKQLRLAPTLMATTPNGFHLVFLYNPSYPQGVNILPGLDIRNDGGFIVGAPSKGQDKLTKEEKNYYWIDSEISPIELPKFDSIFHGPINIPKPEVKNPQWVEVLLKNGVQYVINMFPLLWELISHFDYED